MHGGVPQKRGLSLVHVRTENRMALPCCARQKRLTRKKILRLCVFLGNGGWRPWCEQGKNPARRTHSAPKAIPKRGMHGGKRGPHSLPAGGGGRIGCSLSAEKKRRRHQAVPDKSGMKRIGEAHRRAATKQQNTPPKRKRGRPLADVWAVWFCLRGHSDNGGTAYSQGSLLSS